MACVNEMLDSSQIIGSKKKEAFCFIEEKDATQFS